MDLFVEEQRPRLPFWALPQHYLDQTMKSNKLALSGEQWRQFWKDVRRLERLGYYLRDMRTWVKPDAERIAARLHSIPAQRLALAEEAMQRLVVTHGYRVLAYPPALSTFSGRCLQEWDITHEYF